jgi:plasmid stabilization system protein ParE
MSTPARPEESIDEETKRILTERDKLFEQEEKKARPWRDVKAEILRQSKPLVPWVLVRITPAARADISKGHAHYEAARPGLGNEFVENVDQAVEKIGRNPLAYRKVFGENRRLNLERFPYALYFRVKNDAIVVACIHQRRDPKFTKERGSGVIPFPDP